MLYKDNTLVEEDVSTFFDELEVWERPFVNLVLSSKFSLLRYMSRSRITRHTDYAQANKHVTVFVLVLVLETEAL